jgi:hypothetical protein
MGIERHKEQSETGLYFCLDEFPPSPQRLVELLGMVRRIGFTSIFVEWGDSFPWSLDERFSGRHTYPPDAVQAIEEKCRDLGVTLVPVFPILGGMQRFLSIPAYSHLRAEEDDVGLLDYTNPGAHKFLEDLLDDMLALIPSTSIVLIPDTGIEVTGEATSQTGSQRHLRRLASVLHDRGIRPLFRLTATGAWGVDDLAWMISCGDLTANCSVWKELNHRHVLPEFSELRPAPLFWYEQYLDNNEIAYPNIKNASWARMLTIKNQRKEPDITGPFIEMCFDLITSLQRDTEHTESSDQSDFSFEIRKTVAAFDESVSACWQRLRAIREMLYKMTVNCQCRTRFFTEGIGLINEQKTEINQCAGIGQVLNAGLAGRVDMEWLDQWMNTRLSPLREELSIVESRILQLGA